jgi:uncharacterized protein with PQ loop repeat
MSLGLVFISIAMVMIFNIGHVVCYIYGLLFAIYIKESKNSNDKTK